MALLLKPDLYIFSHIWHHCTTLGVLSSEKKSLSELSELLDLGKDSKKETDAFRTTHGNI